MRPSRQRKSDGGAVNRRDLIVGLAAVALAGSAACAVSGQPPSAATASPGVMTIPLPTPRGGGAVSLERAISSRRSARDFSPQPLSRATLGQLLWAGQGITGPGGKRAAPSAGALYPLELYVLTHNELMRYLPVGHRAEIRDTHDLRPAVRDAALGQDPVTAAPAVVVIAAAIGRTKRKYGARADLYATLEAGHAAQNILLMAAARGLVSVPIGAFDPATVAATLALPSGQTVLYLIPTGWPPHETPDS